MPPTRARAEEVTCAGPTALGRLLIGDERLELAVRFPAEAAHATQPAHEFAGRIKGSGDHSTGAPPARLRQAVGPSAYLFRCVRKRNRRRKAHTCQLARRSPVRPPPRRAA